MAVLAGTTSVSFKATGIVAATMLFLFKWVVTARHISVYRADQKDDPPSFFFAIGLLAIPWLLPSEYAPLPIRAPAAALASGSNWIVSLDTDTSCTDRPKEPSLMLVQIGSSTQFTFLVVEITPVSIKSIGHFTYVYFCVFNACFVPLIYFFYPETANLELEDVDLLFNGEKVLLKLPGVSAGNPASLQSCILTRPPIVPQSYIRGSHPDMRHTGHEETGAEILDRDEKQYLEHRD